MELVIAKKNGEQFKVLYDEQDHELISRYTWHIGGLKYFEARTNIKHTPGKYKQVSMQRLLLNAKDPKTLVDHADRNRLDNRRLNLRSSNWSQNNANRKSMTAATSNYLGVHKSAKRRKWEARIGKNNKSFRIGYFKTEEEAAKAYDKAAVEIHGEFANLNFKVCG